MTSSRGKRRLQLLAPRRAKLLEEKQLLYGSMTFSERIVAYQLVRFNLAWSKALATLSFYREWATAHSLPTRIGSLAELKQFPVLTKEIIRDHQEQISRDVAAATGLFFVSTGG